MSTNPEEISSIIKEQIRAYRSRTEMAETGTVILVGDGIARVYGLRNCMASELLEFEDGSLGMAQNLENETVSVAILSDNNDIRRSSARARSSPFPSAKRCSAAVSTPSALPSTAKVLSTRTRRAPSRPKRPE